MFFRSAPISTARILLMTSAPASICGFKAVRTPRTRPDSRAIICAAMVVVPRSMAIPSPCFPCPTRSASSVRTSIRPCPHSSTNGSSARAWQASRHPEAISSGLNAVLSSLETGKAPASSRTPQPPQMPVPPHGNSTPFAERTGINGEPLGTSISTDQGSNRIRTVSALIVIP